jgi:hypothetical protein
MPVGSPECEQRQGLDRVGAREEPPNCVARKADASHQIHHCGKGAETDCNHQDDSAGPEGSSDDEGNALTVAPKRTPESRARPRSAREVDRRRRVAGAAIGAGLAGIGAGQAFSTPSHPVWVWVLAGVFVWAVPIAALTLVAHWSANVLNRPWADVFWSWDGRRLPDPIGTRGTAIFIGSLIAAFVVVGVTVS